jgi:hypothetical protein
MTRRRAVTRLPVDVDLHGASAFAFCVLFTLLTAATASAQLTTGTIVGNLVDETKAALPGAAIVLTNVETGLTRNIVTDRQGRFEAPNLPGGTYEVTASMQGFGTAVRRGIELAVGRTAVVDMTLPLANMQQELVVTADAPLVETTSATVSYLVNAKRVEDLPLVNRDLTQLTFLQPGVVKIPSSGNQGIFSGMGDKFTVAGARGTQNLYLLDGVSNADLSGNAQGSSGSYMGSETVKEIQIVTNNYSAEYRSAAGGIVSAITKSGTNDLHGSLFEFGRNDALDAANYFDKQFGNPKPDFERNQFGGSIGGPIQKNRLFFFASYEGLREELGTTDTATVPSLSVRQGRLANGQVVNVNPIVVPYLALFPVPGEGNRIVEDFGDTVLIAGTRRQSTTNNFAVGKVDYQVDASNTLSATFNWDKGERSPFGLLAVVGDGVGGTRSKKQVVSTKWTTVLTSASVNEFHFGYSDSKPDGNIPLGDFDFASQGLLFRAERERMGELIIPGVSNIGYRVDAQTNRQRAFMLKEGYSLARGNHSFRLGGELTYYRYNMGSCSRGCNGVFEFGDIRNFLLGVPRRFEVMLPGGDIVNRDMRQSLVAAYFQDNWRVGSDLTFNLGMRYEFASTINEVDDKVSNLVDFFDTEVTVGTLYKNPATKAFSPRIGFVWAPGEGRSSVRGGFGIFYEHPMLYNVRTSLQELPPFTLVGRIDQRNAQQSLGREIDFPNAYFTQIGLASGRPNIRTFQYDLDQTYMYRWNLTYQRQFWGSWVAAADYTGSRGLHLWQQSLPNINKWEGWPEQPPPGTPKFFPAGSSLINPNFGEMRIQYSNANSYYHGGSLSIQKRLSAGLQFSSAFTYSKAIDQGSGVTSGGDELPQSQRGIYAWDMHLKQGLSSYDVRKVFTANLSYELPFGRDLTGIKAALASGWQVNSIITLADGYPLSVTESNSQQITRIGDDEDLRPDLVPGGDNNPITGDPNRYFDVSQFTPSKLGFFGTVGRNTVISPGLATVDLSVFKNFQMGSAGRLQARFETFNLLDRANFGTPDMTAFINGEVNPTAGRITSTRSPARQVQLGVRWTF